MKCMNVRPDPFFPLSDIELTDEQALRHGQVLAGVKTREEVLAEMLASFARPRGETVQAD